MSLTPEEAFILKKAVNIAYEHEGRITLSDEQVDDMFRWIDRETDPRLSPTDASKEDSPSTHARSERQLSHPDLAGTPSTPRVDERSASAIEMSERRPSFSLLPRAQETIRVWTDGACSGNPGPAGIGVLIVEGGDDLGDQPGVVRCEISEYLGESTNNIAELTAISRGLQLLLRALQGAEVMHATDPPICERRVRLYSDSAYALGVLSLGWKAKRNIDLIDRIRQCCRRFSDLQFIKVPAHAGVGGNPRADALATDAIRRKSSTAWPQNGKAT